ncbi:MAG: D-2-hydroxyacid dehydrogenase [Candidatus Latescibacterota bacterium]|jgi:glycerate dehydrogenase
MRIVVLDGFTLNPGDNPWDEIAALGELIVYDRTPADQVGARAREAGIVLTNKTPVAGADLERLPDLRLISVLATGYNIVDVEAARRLGVRVANVPVYGTDAVAQFVFALLLEHCHHVARHDEAVRRGRWAEGEDFSFWETPLVELAGLKLGIVGFGRIGRRVGELGHAFGMEVLACDLDRQRPPGYAPFAWRECDELFSEADVVTLHCPQTPENARFVNRELLGRMKPSALLINTARGGLIDEEALAEALGRGRPAAAAVDVVSREPIAPDSPLLNAPHLILTPHIAWATLSARRRLMRMTAANLRAFLEGRPINLVN